MTDEKSSPRKNASKKATTKDPKTPKNTSSGKTRSKLNQVATEVVNEQLGLKPTPLPLDENEPLLQSKKTDLEDTVSDSEQDKPQEKEPEVLIIPEESDSEPDHAVVVLAKTELQIEKAKNKNYKDEMALLTARLAFRNAMGGESWEEFNSKQNHQRNKMQTQNASENLHKNDNNQSTFIHPTMTHSEPSMQSFRPIQTSSRENSSFRASVETKQTFSQHVWFEGIINNVDLRAELSEYAVDTLDGIIDWFKETGNLVEKLMSNGGQVWKSWVSKLIQLKTKVKKLVTRYEAKPDILVEIKCLLNAMEFWYSHVNSEAEIKGTFQFIASWAEEAKTREVMGSNMANDFKRALAVSRNDQSEKFVHMKSTLQLRTMNSSAEWKSKKSYGSSSSSYSSRSKDHYKSRDRSSTRKDSNYNRRDSRRYSDRRDNRRGGHDRRDDRRGDRKEAGENSLPVKQF